MTPHAHAPPHLRSPRMPCLSRSLTLLAAAVTLTACAGQDVVAPSQSRVARITVAANASTPLTSLGDTVVLTHTALDADGNPVSGARLRWSVRPAGIIHEDSDGVFRAIGNGQATIVAELDPSQAGVRPAGYYVGQLSDSVVVTVRQIAARITLAPVDTVFGLLGSSRQLHAQVTDARGNALLDGPPQLLWHSADTTVVTVDSAGMVRSRGQGSAHVTVQAAELTGVIGFSVDARMPYTSCMVFAERQRTVQSCVTIDFTMRARTATQ